jgi:hypothetical protein
MDLQHWHKLAAWACTWTCRNCAKVHNYQVYINIVSTKKLDTDMQDVDIKMEHVDMDAQHGPGITAWTWTSGWDKDLQHCMNK